MNKDLANDPIQSNGVLLLLGWIGLLCLTLWLSEGVMGLVISAAALSALGLLVYTCITPPPVDTIQGQSIHGYANVFVKLKKFERHDGWALALCMAGVPIGWGLDCLLRPEGAVWIGISLGLGVVLGLGWWWLIHHAAHHADLLDRYLVVRRDGHWLVLDAHGAVVDSGRLNALFDGMGHQDGPWAKAIVDALAQGPQNTTFKKRPVFVLAYLMMAWLLNGSHEHFKKGEMVWGLLGLLGICLGAGMILKEKSTQKTRPVTLRLDQHGIGRYAGADLEQQVPARLGSFQLKQNQVILGWCDDFGTEQQAVLRLSEWRSPALSRHLAWLHSGLPWFEPPHAGPEDLMG